jgi:hypothetical protein
MLYEGDGIQLVICACYSWEMALTVGLDVSFGKCGSGKEYKENKESQ